MSAHDPSHPVVAADVDRARRCSDVVNTHILAHVPAGGGFPDWNGPRPWIAVRLSDGTSDGNLYPSKQAAKDHQLHPKQCAYLTIPDGGMTVRQAIAVLHFTQQMYDNGVDLADPDIQIHTPVRPETNVDVIKNLRSK